MLSGISPSSGPTSGGNTVILMGSGFTGATDVPFGSFDITTTPCGSAPCFNVDKDGQITVQGVPAAGPGPVSVSVNTPGGPTGTLTYTYFSPPTLTSLSPPSGPTAGGNSVILTGTGFTGATDVNFGSNDLNPCVSGECFTVNSDTKITVSGVLASSAGGVPVNVVTPGGTTAPNLTYTYVTGPTLTSLSPPSGPTAGGNSVILTGTGFTGATDVNFGSNDLNPCVSGECFTVNS
ncbi:MAG: IPT/TIG domain-containing protein, partial [Candidatus Dormibacteria bacterium]